MNKKKILIVSKYFFPVINPRSFRTTELAKELARQGNDITVLIPKKGIDYSDFEKEHKLKILDLGILNFQEIEISAGKIKGLFERVLRRSLQLLFEYPDIELMFKVKRKLKR